MENKIVKIEINIEWEMEIGTRLTAEVNEMLFTNLSYTDATIDAHILNERVAKVIRKFGNFTMITFSVTVRNNYDNWTTWRQDNRTIVNEFRVVNRYHKVEYAPIGTDNRFTDWKLCKKSIVKNLVGECVSLANDTFANLRSEQKIA